MDPDVTLAIMRDESADLIERDAAAHALWDWLWRGGFVPVCQSDRGALMRECSRHLEGLSR